MTDKNVMGLLIGVVIIAVIIAFVVLPQISTITQQQDRIDLGQSLPGCCISLTVQNPTCSGGIGSFQCDVSEKFSKNKKMSLEELYKRINDVKSVSEDKLRETCQCPAVAAP